MSFYSLSKTERTAVVETIYNEIREDTRQREKVRVLRYFSDEDTYIRKAGYLAVGKIYKEDKKCQEAVITFLDALLAENDFKVRQTVINAAGEIGKSDFAVVEYFFDKGLFDENPAVRNAVIGSIKKMGEKNPAPVLLWARKYLHHENKEIRREICHGIELRGRTHPEDILPLLRELQFDKTARVRNTLVHVLGQIAYKKNCLATVIEALNTWENKEVVEKALDEIVDVHLRYKDFAILTQEQAIAYISTHYRK
jgi:HEAT repeat protein